MTKQGAVLSVIAVLLGAAYAYYFTDWFRKPTIQIIPSIRVGRPSAIPRAPDQPPVFPVSFALAGDQRLTEVKVMAADELATNKYAQPLWHLVSDSNSIPTRSIVYGMPIRGMRPAVKRAKPRPLEPDVRYVLMIAAGRVRAQTNFFTREYVSPTLQ